MLKESTWAGGRISRKGTDQLFLAQDYVPAPACAVGSAAFLMAQVGRIRIDRHFDYRGLGDILFKGLYPSESGIMA
jgi:hypothetical protein